MRTQGLNGAKNCLLTGIRKCSVSLEHILTSPSGGSMATRTAHQRWRTRRPAFPKVCNPVPTNSVNGAKRSSRQCRQRPPQSPKTVQPRVTQPHPRGRKQTTTTTRGGPRRDRNRDITAARCLRLPSPTCRHSATTRVCLNTTPDLMDRLYDDPKVSSRPFYNLSQST